MSSQVLLKSFVKWMGLVGEDAEPIVLRIDIRKSNHPNSAVRVSSVSLEKEETLLSINTLDGLQHISGLRY